MDKSRAPLILIADDTLQNVQVLGAILKKQGYNLALAKDGAQAVDQAYKLNPDLILLDVMMPEMDGFEACRELKSMARTKDIPIIFLTALSGSEDVIKGLEYGGADYVAKPFNAAELLARVRTQLELRERQNEIHAKSYELKELLHVLCHDMLVPLGTIFSLLEHLEESPEDFKECRTYMKDVTANALDLISLIRKMRAVEEKSLHPLPVNLNHSVTNSLTMVESKAREKKITINVDLVENCPEVMAEETSLINSVLNNLLTNAIKFSYEGSVILLTTAIDHDRVVLKIVDQGIGMPEILMADLFDLSKATSRPGTKNERGTGFGMPLVKKFTDIYGAELLVRSREEKEENTNHGTEIEIRFVRASGQPNLLARKA